MKYEAVFGDQSLFDGASEFVEVIRFNDYSRDFLWGDLNTIQLLTFKELKAIPIVAMRRIIAEPKRWTVEEQKAGRLPEVGCRIYVPIMFEEQNVIYSSEKVIVSISDNGGAVTRTEVASINRIKPIETPEEKAQRLKSEWCANAAKQLKNLEHTSTLTSIYDAMLHGELTIPSKDGE